jgi:hypothetical protein
MATIDGIRREFAAHRKRVNEEWDSLTLDEQVRFVKTLSTERREELAVGQYGPKPVPPELIRAARDSLIREFWTPLLDVPAFLWEEIYQRSRYGTEKRARAKSKRVVFLSLVYLTAFELYKRSGKLPSKRDVARDRGWGTDGPTINGGGSNRTQALNDRAKNAGSSPREAMEVIRAACREAWVDRLLAGDDQAQVPPGGWEYIERQAAQLKAKP